MRTAATSAYCFVERDEDKTILGLNDKWYPLGKCRTNLGRLCRFEAGSASRKAESLQCGARAITEDVVRMRMGFQSPSWDKYWATALRNIRVCPFTEEDMRAACVREAALELASPAVDTKAESGTGGGTLVRSDPAVLAESFDTPLIRDTVETLTHLSDLSQEWLKVALQLSGRLWALENAIEDELHFAEFRCLDAESGNRCYQRIHQLRLERRQLKNERNLVGIINTAMQKPAYNFALLQLRLGEVLDGFQKAQEKCYTVRERWPYEEN